MLITEASDPARKPISSLLGIAESYTRNILGVCAVILHDDVIDL